MKNLKLLSNKPRFWLRRFIKENTINLNIKTFEGVLYLLKTGCQWRMIPQKFGHWKSLYHYFRSWSEHKWFSKLQRKLIQHSRRRLKRSQSPTIIVIDSQGVKSGLSKSTKCIDVQCVKSNFGTSEFIPVNGRWVVERTISWLDNYRRLARNYEQHLHTASAMAKFAFIALMLNRIL